MTEIYGIVTSHVCKVRCFNFDIQLLCSLFNYIIIEQIICVSHSKELVERIECSILTMWTLKVVIIEQNNITEDRTIMTIRLSITGMIWAQVKVSE